MVSRGYIKIQFAHQKLGFNPRGKVCVDIGCSTGGFTEFLLEKGAKKIYCVDIGKNLLHASLRDKVVVMEGVDAKNITKDMFDETPEFATVDVSFTSSIPILRAISFIKEVVLLCKPNFEVPRRYLEKGVLKNRNIAKLAIKKVILNVSDIFVVRGLTFSSILGAEGNIEFFIWFDKDSSAVDDLIIERTVEEAFEILQKRS